MQNKSIKQLQEEMRSNAFWKLYSTWVVRLSAENTSKEVARRI